MFPSFESWLACNYGGSDDTASTAKKVAELLSGSCGTLAPGAPLPCHE